MARVVVIGAGMTGLSVAIRLADLGHAVTVLEGHDAPGGHAGRLAFDDVVVDTGPSTFTLPAVFRDLFGKTGRRLDREIDLVPVDPAVRYVLPDATVIDLPNASRAGAIDAIDAALGPGTGLSWDALIRRGEQMWRALRPPVVERALSRRDVIALALRPAARREAGLSTSLQSLGTELLGDPRLRAMLDAVAVGLGADPASAPASLATLVYLDHTFGVWTVTGGVRTLVDALERRANERGAAIRYGAPVARVRTDRGRVRGVDLADGTGLTADLVVSAVPPRRLDDLLDRSRRRMPIRDRGEPAGAGASQFSMFLAANEPHSSRPRRTVVLNGDAGPTTTILAPEPSTASPAEPAAWALHATCPSHGQGPGEIDWTRPGRAEAFASELLHVVSARGIDLPTPPTSAAWRLQTPFDLERRTGAPGGRSHDDLWGGSWAGVAQLWRRPGYRTAIAGLLDAAGPAHPVPGLPMTGMAAVIVADLVGRA